MVIDPVKMVVEAGELSVSRDEVIGPNKLRMLADAGWSIASAWNQSGGGFVMLMQRQIGETEPKKIDVIVHEGGIRCPDYCGCEPV